MLTDDEILDYWHEARGAHKAAAAENKDEAWIKSHQAEHQAIERFSLGEHQKAYKEHFPEAD